MAGLHGRLFFAYLIPKFSGAKFTEDTMGKLTGNGLLLLAEARGWGWRSFKGSLLKAANWQSTITAAEKAPNNLLPSNKSQPESPGIPGGPD